MSEKLLLIDGHSIVHRAFYGVPDLTNSTGLHTNGIYGFLNIMFRILEEEKPEYLVVAFDEHAPTFRHGIYEGYKGTRKPMPEELREQIPVLRELLEKMEITCLSIPGLEADDILGTMAKKSQAEGIEVTLVSGDRDLLQIADEHIKILIPKTIHGKTTIEAYYPADVKEKYQVTPLQFIELKALMGDTADNIPGVPKIGEKTATDLMVTYGSIENIYLHIDEISKKSIHDTLAQNRGLADLSLTLATIKTDCPVSLDKEISRAEGFFTAEAYEIMKRLEFKKFLEQFSSSITQKVVEKEVPVIVLSNLSEFEEALKRACATDAGMHFLLEDSVLYGVALCFAANEEKRELSRYYFAPSAIEASEVIFLIRKMVSSAQGQLSFIDIKAQYEVLPYEKMNAYADAMIGAYLINPLKNDYDACSIALEYCDKTIRDKKEYFGKFSYAEASLTIPEACREYASDIAQIAYLSMPKIRYRMEEMGLEQLFNELEMPLSYVLYDMQRVGVRVKRDDLAEYGNALTGRIAELEKKIHVGAGEVFNINSPKALGEILFEKMGIPGGKKTKTGYSTAADVLEKLAPDYPFVNDILEYRTLSKLKSTYADGLAGYIGEDERIHSNFNQTITATGRISSTEPNLQNIPIRTEIGRELRKVFVPTPGNVLVDADYSQIELRILASLSEDEGLIEAYREAQDIHRITASKVFHTPFDEVTDLQRRNAKAVNFGIVYGISSFGLSQDLSISRKEAAEYIEKYFETYPGIKRFLDNAVKEAKEKGYSVTYFGRRRPIPELSSSNFMQRSFGERVAMNAPIQGTAADIMKLAMLHVWEELRQKKYQSKLILQVHDELVIDAVPEELENIKELLVRNMTGAAALAVSLEVSMEVGSNWYEAH